MIDIPKDFLKEEIRCDYLVTEKMKKVWAVEMDLLCELDRVCTKYDIPYYASSGTLIGAIRHKGFIPWDDDIDVTMRRDDYNRLAAVAEKEFKHPYFLQDAYTDGFLRGFARLRNSDTTALTKKYADRDINQGIFIDIFIFDKVPDDKLKKKIWLAQVRLMHKFTNAMFEEGSESQSKFHVKAAVKLCKMFYSLQSLARKYDKLCSKYNNKDEKTMTCVGFSLGNERHTWECKWFEGSHKVPFEFITIRIPDGYDERLRHEYGDYMIMKKAPTLHGSVLFDPDTPYKEFLQKHTYEEIKKMISEL